MGSETLFVKVENDTMFVGRGFDSKWKMISKSGGRKRAKYFFMEFFISTLVSHFK